MGGRNVFVAHNKPFEILNWLSFEGFKNPSTSINVMRTPSAAEHFLKVLFIKVWAQELPPKGE